jgi:hypothetical protein
VNALLANELTHVLSVGEAQAQHIDHQLRVTIYNLLRQWLNQNPPSDYQWSVLKEILGVSDFVSQDWSNRPLVSLLATAKFLGIPAFELAVHVFR